jgi:hypothetical protein
MNIGRSLAFAAALMLIHVAAAQGEANFGHFVGKFVAEFGEDGRRVTLMEPFGYVDPVGIEWNVPDGYKTDGASVPAALWALYPPFTGNYRSAAVIHDYYCDNKERSWQDTHKVFYYAMRASDVDERTAKVMYGAVYLFGPRWGPGTAPGQRNAAPVVSQGQQVALMKELKALVETENPDLDKLLAEAKRMARPGGIAPAPEGMPEPDNAPAPESVPEPAE